MMISEVNALCAELSEAAMLETVELMVDEMELEMLMADPRFFGPDAGADDCNGSWYWEVK